MPALIGSGYIAFTVDQGEHTERYQGIVELAGANLAECAQHYFRQSEQIQAGIKLSVARSGENGAWRAGGLMLQRVPPEGGYTVIADDVEDGWRRAMVLMSSATPDELVDPELPPRRLLFRLFHEDGVRVFETHPLEARCRCSRERIVRILRSLSARRHRRDALGAGHDRDLRILQHALRVHGGRSGPAQLVVTPGKFPVRREYVVLRAAPVEKTGGFRRCRAKFPRSEQGDFRRSSGSRHARSGELRVPSLPVLPGSGSPMPRLSSAHNATRVWRF